MRFCELKEKEVINVCNCKRLGYVIDLALDVCKGTIEAIIIPGPGRAFGLFGCDAEYIIPFECIRKVGDDMILVEICEEKFLHQCK